MKSAAGVICAFVLFAGSEAALRFGQRDPAGAGQPEPTKGGACAECAKHAPYLNRGDDCVCFASDIMTTFENDATKKLTTASKYSHTTVNTGAEKLSSGWMWHCRPLGAKGTWEQC